MDADSLQDPVMSKFSQKCLMYFILLLVLLSLLNHALETSWVYPLITHCEALYI